MIRESSTISIITNAMKTIVSIIIVRDVLSWDNKLIERSAGVGSNRYNNELNAIRMLILSEEIKLNVEIDGEKETRKKERFFNHDLVAMLVLLVFFFREDWGLFIKYVRCICNAQQAKVMIVDSCLIE